MDETRPHDPHQPPLPPGGGGPDKTEDLSGISEIFGLDPEPAGDDPLVGTDLGGVTIVRLIAEGGMGRVYEGRQHRPDREVAVKVMRPGVSSAELLRRFEYETQVLGRLTHPGIAQIYTVGTHAVRGAQVPYFVMEYIPQARTITQYAADLNLTTQERLELFRKVCDAVAYGHHKGVIHRDLKPGNILVDAAGQPRVIDFGVARSTDADMAITTQHTAVGQLIGTVQYMSPEQFNADPGDVDTRADVYALGVVLYELLAGKPPYDVRRKAIFEAARVVREDEPRPLSAVNRMIRRDMAVIAGKCLEKDRNLRYSTASELSADIRRFLDGDVVMAAPPRFLSRWHRFIRRRRIPLAITAMAIVATAAVVFAGSRQREAIRGLREAAQAKTFANAEASRARSADYVRKLGEMAAAIDEGNADRTQQLDREVTKLLGDAPPQIELRWLRSRADASILVLPKYRAELFPAPKRRSISFSSDGSRLATSAADGIARVWDTQTGEERLFLKYEWPSYDRTSPIGWGRVQFSPDGRRLATWAARQPRDEAATVRDATSGERLYDLAGVFGTGLVEYSPDNRLLATSSPNGLAAVWDAATGERLYVVEEGTHGGRLYSLAFSHDSSRLALGAHSGAVSIVESSTGKLLVTCGRPGRGQATAVAFSRDSARIVSATSADHEGPIRIYDVDTGAEVARLRGEHYGVEFAAYTPDSRRIILMEPRGITVWTPETNDVVAIPAQQKFTSVALAPDGRRLATASEDTVARVWDVNTGQRISAFRGHAGPLTDVAYVWSRSSPRGTSPRPDCRLATASRDGTVRLWETDVAGACGVLAMGCERHGRVGFSPDGSLVFVTAGEDGPTHLCETWTGRRLARVENAVAAAFHPDGQRIVFKISKTNEDADDGPRGGPTRFDYRIHDLVTAERLTAIAGSAGSGDTAIGFSSDGRRLATTERQFPPDQQLRAINEDSAVVIWDIASSARLLTMPEDPIGGTRLGSSAQLAFSPAGDHLAVAGNPWGHGTATIWNVDGGPGRLLSNDARGIAFSPDGKRLAIGCGDGAIRVWDTASGREKAQWRGHRLAATAVAWTTDGGRVVTGAKDGTIRIWEAIAGSELLALQVHDGPVTSVALSPDGTQVASSSEDGTARLWGISNAELYRRRRVAEALQERLTARVKEWVGQGRNAVRTGLADSHAVWTVDERREARNIAIRQAWAGRKSP